jgi:hypothetical protein
MTLLWDTDAAHETAGTYLGVANLLNPVNLTALETADALVDAVAILIRVREVSDEAAALQQECRDHADELRNAAVIVERHESLLTQVVRALRQQALDAPLPRLATGFGLPGVESLLRDVSLGAPPVHLLEEPAGPEWSLGAMSVADWMERCDRLLEATFAISLIGDQVVVVLPGIHSLLPSGDVQDLTGAVRELVTSTSGYHEAVLKALQGMALPPGVRITLIGHSQGGIVAMDPRVRALGPVTHVVTAGSPVDGIPTAPGTQVLEVVNPDDAVPALDGRPPVAGPGRAVVMGQPGPVRRSHTLAGSPQAYATVMSLPGVLDRGDVKGFLSGAAGWLDGQPAQTTIVTALDGR